MADILNGLSSLSGLLKNPAKFSKELAGMAPELLSNLPAIQSALNPEQIPLPEQLVQTEFPEITTSVPALSVVSIGNIITFILVIYAILLLLKEYTGILSKEQKDNINYFNDVVFGNVGFFLIILLLWVCIYFYTVFLPVMSNLNDLTMKIGNVIPLLLSFAGGK